MLDKKLKMMLDTAATLTADDLDSLRGSTSADRIGVAEESDMSATASDADVDQAECVDEHAVTNGAPSVHASASPVTATPRRRATTSSGGISAGEYERQRTRESKVATACIGHEREKHDWWPLGTTVVGRIGSEPFTATVVENTQVKSNRSLLITSGPASGRVCITPTRAAMEATEAFRQAHNLGRGGGVTNGWDFWQAQG